MFPGVPSGTGSGSPPAATPCITGAHGGGGGASGGGAVGGAGGDAGGGKLSMEKLHVLPFRQSSSPTWKEGEARNEARCEVRIIA